MDKPRENQRGNQEWINPETSATLDTQDTERRQTDSILYYPQFPWEYKSYPNSRGNTILPIFHLNSFNFFSMFDFTCIVHEKNVLPYQST
jgi:hypothetical protein